MSYRISSNDLCNGKLVIGTQVIVIQITNISYYTKFKKAIELETSQLYNLLVSNFLVKKNSNNI